MEILERSGADPAPGFYPVPDHHHKHVVEREWDGARWTGEVRAAPDGESLPSYKRHVFHFLRDPGWKLFLLLLVSTGIASALWATDRKADWVHGVQLLAPPFALIATATAMVALLVFLNRRIGFDRIPPETRKSIVKWGVISAFAGFAIAYGVEVGIPRIFGDPKDEAWSLLAGPAEETGKLLIPVILWVKGRFRLPREGYLLVLISAMVFGIGEGLEYSLSPDKWQPARPVFELMHPMFTGFIAVVAWQAAWNRKSWFTGAAIGAWLIAVGMHSVNDFVVLEKLDFKGSEFISIFAIVAMYLLQKHSARNLVPPDKVGAVSPRWRPVAPKGAAG